HKIDDLHPVEVTDRFDTILVDGYYPELAVRILKAQAGQATVVLDADVWNDGTDPIMPFVDIVICSDDFVPPGTASRESVRQAILGYGPAQCAFTHGAQPIEWFDENGGGTVDIPKVDVIDTLGAGDIFHGAFCFYYAATASFEDALAMASKVAGTSCTSFGTRNWMVLPEAQKLKPENAQ
ncbi:MAG: PfkB family carbohydrate kinase, partial [Alphaproteobacteria bacterium]|nr:PfkB family carbohydrate kinase [Alphaproteobacteria bacterium]